MELNNNQKRLLSIKQRQEQWKSEAIEKAVDILLGATQREKDWAIKELLRQIKAMPMISEYDIDLESEDVPF